MNQPPRFLPWALGAVIVATIAAVLIVGRAEDTIAGAQDPAADLAPISGTLSRSAWERDPERFIAHAGGGLLGQKYTNAEEAVLASIANGYRMIELDLLVTADGQLVAAHDWRQFKTSTGDAPDRVDDSPLSLADFARRKIGGTLTPLTEARIRQLFSENSQLVLVTDKIRDFRRLRAAFPFQDRLIVEVFGSSEFDRARRAGIINPMLSIFNIEQQIEFIETAQVRLIAASSKEIARRPEVFARLLRSGRRIFAFSSNAHDFLDEHLDRTVTAFYTDFWDLKSGRCRASVCETY